eukprot:12524851-Prorocentrum_lima.AAC.1
MALVASKLLYGCEGWACLPAKWHAVLRAVYFRMAAVVKGGRFSDTEPFSYTQLLQHGQLRCMEELITRRRLGFLVKYWLALDEGTLTEE